MYQQGLSLERLGEFKDHEGFDGIMLGTPSGPYHFEFTREAGHRAPRSHSPESLLVFYVPDAAQYQTTVKDMEAAGFVRVKGQNPYWDKNGSVFEDPEGYRVVICKQDWKG